MKVKLAVAVFAVVFALSFVPVRHAEAFMVTGTWTGCVSGMLKLHLEDKSNAPFDTPVEFYDVTGQLNSDLQYPITGTAVFDTSHNVYRMSLFSTSATGETFTFGIAIDPYTMVGTGNEQRIAHGSVDADCPGTLTGLIIQ